MKTDKWCIAKVKEVRGNNCCGTWENYYVARSLELLVLASVCSTARSTQWYDKDLLLAATVLCTMYYHLPSITIYECIFAGIC